MIDEKTLDEIKKKAELFDDAKNRILESIRCNTREAIEKLKAVENILLNEVESAFGDNPFSNFLCEIDGLNCTDERIKEVLSIEIPQNFGPDEKTFQSLIKEIESISAWKERKEKYLSLVPTHLKMDNNGCDKIDVSWDKPDCDCYYEVELKSPSDQSTYYTLEPKFTFSNLKSSTKYEARARAIMFKEDDQSIWSEPIAAQTTRSFSECRWKGDFDIYTNGSRIATKIDTKSRQTPSGIKYTYNIIAGDIPIPLNKDTSWGIRILKSKNNDGYGIFVGVAQSGIGYEWENSWWCLNCYDLRIYTGSIGFWTHLMDRYNGKDVRTGDIVNVTVDTTNGRLLFTIRGTPFWNAHQKIPIDKPLVPCMLLCMGGDSVELIIKS